MIGDQIARDSGSIWFAFWHRQEVIAKKFRPPLNICFAAKKMRRVCLIRSTSRLLKKFLEAFFSD
jgi:hypothetical protein